MGGRQTEDLEVPGLKYALKIPGPREEFFLISHHLDFFFFAKSLQRSQGAEKSLYIGYSLGKHPTGCKCDPVGIYEENKRPLSKFSVDSTE